MVNTCVICLILPKWHSILYNSLICFQAFIVATRSLHFDRQGDVPVRYSSVIGRSCKCGMFTLRHTTSDTLAYHRPPAFLSQFIMKNLSN